MAALLAILLVAAGLRLYGLRWEDDLGGYPHPDERHLANTMTRVSIPWPIDWALLNDPNQSPLNPRRLVPGSETEHYDLAYGTLPVYLYRATAAFLAWASHDPTLDAYDAYGLIGRTVTVFFSLLTVLWVYELGRHTFGQAAALLAAALLAVCVLHIQLSHFMTVDLLMSAMIIAGLLIGVRFARDGRTVDAFGMGAMLGLSMSCKFNAITLGAGIASAYAVAWLAGKRKLLDLLVYSIPLTVIGWALCFGLVEYYAVRDPYTYAQAIGTQAKMVTGQIDWPYTRQYVNTAPYLFQLRNLLAWGMGWVLGATGVAGVGASAVWLVVSLMTAAVRTVRTPDGGGWRVRWFSDPRHAGSIVLIGWAIPYFLYTGRLEVKFLRYMLPLTPVLCLFAADAVRWAADQLVAWRHAHHQESQGNLWQLGPHSVGSTLVLLPTVLWALAYMRVYAQEHPWEAASRWFYLHAPDQSVYTWEAWGDPLPVDLPVKGEQRSVRGYRDVVMQIYDDMSPPDKLQHIAESLRQADYVVLSTPRIYLSVSRLPWRYPVEIRYYQLLFTGQLGYELAAKFSAFPGIGPFEVNDLAADQSFYDYDHPPVLIWKKTRDLSATEWQALFAEQLKATPQVTRRGTEPPVRLPTP